MVLSACLCAVFLDYPVHVNRLMRIVFGTLDCYRIRYSTNKRCIKECVIAVLCYYQIVCALLFWVIQCMLTVHKHHMLFFPNVFFQKKMVSLFYVPGKTHNLHRLWNTRLVCLLSNHICKLCSILLTYLCFQ